MPRVSKNETALSPLKLCGESLYTTCGQVLQPACQSAGKRKRNTISISFSSSSCQQSPLAKPNQNSCCRKPFMLPVSASFWAGSRMEKGEISLWVRGKSYSSPRKFTFLCSGKIPGLLSSKPSQFINPHSQFYFTEYIETFKEEHCHQ